MAQPITLALATDDDVIRFGLTRMLAPFAEAVCFVGDGRWAWESNRTVDVVLVDPCLRGEPRYQRAAQLVHMPAAPRIVGYSWSVHPSLVRSAVELGLSGYLPKALSARPMVHAVVDIMAGRLVLPRCVDAGRCRDVPRVGLTEREAEIVTFITAGHSNQEVADLVFGSVGGVRRGISSAYRKMGVTRRTQAVLWGLEHGMGPGDGV